MNQLEPLMTAREVADLFGRKLRTLSNWEREGHLIPIRIRGRRYFRRSDVEAVLGIRNPRKSVRFTEDE
jgi:DNA-binding transcriptional MerR regulator